jgi:hypothetical protein
LSSSERCGDPALVDQRLDEGVVVRDLAERTVAHEVGTGVTDMGQAYLVSGEEHRGQRGAHALPFGVLTDQLADRSVAGQGGFMELVQQVVAGFVVVERGECRNDDFGRHLACRVTTHPVGQRQQARTRVDGVLVVLPNQAAVAPGGIAQNQSHERSSITVLPIRIGTPGGTRVGPVTLARSR